MNSGDKSFSLIGRYVEAVWMGIGHFLRSLICSYRLLCRNLNAIEKGRPCWSFYTFLSLFYLRSVCGPGRGPVDFLNRGCWSTNSQGKWFSSTSALMMLLLLNRKLSLFEKRMVLGTSGSRGPESCSAEGSDTGPGTEGAGAVSAVLGRRKKVSPSFGRRKEVSSVLGRRKKVPPAFGWRKEVSPVLGRRTEVSPVFDWTAIWFGCFSAEPISSLSLQFTRNVSYFSLQYF